MILERQQEKTSEAYWDWVSKPSELEFQTAAERRAHNHQVLWEALKTAETELRIDRDSSTPIIIPINDLLIVDALSQEILPIFEGKLVIKFEPHFQYTPQSEVFSRILIEIQAKGPSSSHIIKDEILCQKLLFFRKLRPVEVATALKPLAEQAGVIELSSKVESYSFEGNGLASWMAFAQTIVARFAVDYFSLASKPVILCKYFDLAQANKPGLRRSGFTDRVLEDVIAFSKKDREGLRPLKHQEIVKPFDYLAINEWLEDLEDQITLVLVKDDRSQKNYL